MTKGYNLNKIGRGPLDNVSYQISKLKPPWYNRISFFILFLLYNYKENQWTPGTGPILTPGLFEIMRVLILTVLACAVWRYIVKSPKQNFKRLYSVIDRIKDDFIGVRIYFLNHYLPF
jgi:hypothetical protein